MFPPPVFNDWTGQHSNMHRMFHEPDITRRILIRLRESTTASAFLPCIRVSRTWYEIGSTIFEAAIVVNEATIGKFLLPIRRRPLRVRSFTLRLSTSYPEFYSVSGLQRTPSIDARLRELSHTIGRDMKSLHTFSFMIEHSGHPHQHQQNGHSKPYLSSKSLAEVLEALPSTCRNLEIDTGGIEYYYPNSHLCSILLRFSGNAEHIRLRLGRLCRNFISPNTLPTSTSSPVAPRLKTLVINMGREDRGELPSDCSSSSSWKRLPAFLGDCFGHPFYFPQIEEIKVFSTDMQPAHGQREIFCHDIIRSSSENRHLKFILEQDIDQGNKRPLRCLHNQDQVFIVAHDTASRDHYEEAWVTVASGARLPESESSYLDLTDNLVGYALKHDLARPGASHLPPHIISPVLWQNVS